MEEPTAEILVAGIGNDLRSDDGVGLYVARQIDKEGIANVAVIAGVSDGTSLLDAWENKRHAFVIDAVQSASTPGHLHRFDGLGEEIPEDCFVVYSTHSFSIVDAVKLGLEVEKCPQKLTVIGIEGKDFSPGDRMSGEVKAAADRLIAELIDELRARTGVATHA